MDCMALITNHQFKGGFSDGIEPVLADKASTEGRIKAVSPSLSFSSTSASSRLNYHTYPLHMWLTR